MSTATFSDILMGFLSIDAMNMRTKFDVRSCDN